MAKEQKSDLRWQIAQFFERNWWRWYMRNKDQAQYLNWKRTYWQQFLDQCGLQVPEQSVILDAGCGPAGIFTIFGQHQVTAIDPLLDQYAADLSQFDPKSYPWVHFETASLEEWQPKQAYDLIFCLNAINHVKDIAAATQTLKAAAKPGATILISTDAHHHSLLQKIFSLAPGDILHPHQYTLQGYLDVFAKAGLHDPKITLIKKEGIFDYYALEYKV